LHEKRHRQARDPSAKPQAAREKKTENVIMLEANDESIEPTETDEPTESRRRKRKPTSIRVAALNITSFLDMSFCLLTFLILSASLTAPEGVLAAKLPMPPPGTEAGGEVVPPEKELRILITSTTASDCRIAIDGMPAATPDFKSLTAQLERLQFSERNPAGIYRANNSIIIVASNDCRWQHIVNAFNAAIAAKFSNVSFAAPE
jgi:biopolymer transport protein ExbD